MHSATYVDELNALLDTSSPPSLTEADDQRLSNSWGGDTLGVALSRPQWVAQAAAAAVTLGRRAQHSSQA